MRGVARMWPVVSADLEDCRELTESRVRRNPEAGVFVIGGAAPQRTAEHIRELQRRGILRPLP
ncbi:hypothetical protein ACVW19_005181 [Streptomyces sp. TE5632]